MTQLDAPGSQPTTPEARVRVTGRDRRARFGASGAFVVQGLMFAAVLSQVSVLQKKFGFDELELTAVLAAVPVIAGVGSVLAGILAPRIGSANVLRVAALGVCAGAAAIGFADTRTLLYVTVGLFGLMVGAVDATMNMQAVAVQRRYGRSILASCHGWWTVGGIISAWFALEAARRGSHLLDGTVLGGDWIELSLRDLLLAFASFGVVVVLISAPFMLSRAEEIAAEPVHQDTPEATKIRWAPVVVVGLAVMVMYIGDSSTTNWSTVFLADGVGAKGGWVQAGLFTYLGCQLIGRAFADRAIGRFGASVTAVAGAVLAAGGFAVVASATRPPVAIVGFALVGMGLSVVLPLSFSAADALDPAGSGVVVARVNLFNYVGVIVGTALIGVVAEAVDLRFAFWVPAGLVLLIIVLAPSFRVVDAGIWAARAARSSAAR